MSVSLKEESEILMLFAARWLFGAQATPMLSQHQILCGLDQRSMILAPGGGKLPAAV